MPAGASQELSFGQQLRRLRLLAGLTREALAERSGVSVATLAALEGAQRRRPYPNTAVALAEALQLSPADRQGLLELASGTAALSEPTPVEPTPITRSTRRVWLPTPPTALIGRDADLATAIALLDPSASAVPLLTMLGPGGVGKTRLALAVAAQLVGAYCDGVVFVDLGLLRDHKLVPATIANALEVRESSRRGSYEQLLAYLRERQVLLVLDNFEHLQGAVPLLAELLETCPRLALLVTSRVALRLRSEHRFAVTPLAVPNLSAEPTLSEIAAAPAVQLFVERAQAVAQHFVLDATTAPAVAAICQRLDGMPLSLELAAARSGLLQPGALLRRVERRLPLLTGGTADLPERQQTLLNTLAWSHDLLQPREQTLFRRLAVFQGGSTLEAAERVCTAQQTSGAARAIEADLGADELIEAVQTLIDNSLLRPVRAETGERLLVMLETVREYALDCLARSGEAERIQDRHLAWSVELAERAAQEMSGPLQGVWLVRLDRMLDNVRAALTWARASRRIEPGLRVAGSLGWFWSIRRHVSEGREWLEALLQSAAEEEVAAAVRATACYAAGLLASIQGDYVWAIHRLEQSIPLYRAAGDTVGAVRARNTRGGVAFDQGNLAEALELWTQTAGQARATGDLGEMAHAVGNQGEALFHMGNVTAAEQRHVEALALARQAGRTDLEAMQLGNLGNVARKRGELALASKLHRQALGIKHELGAHRQIAITLADLAGVAGAEGRGTRAARLVAAATGLREALGVPQPVPERNGTDEAVAPALAALSEEARVAAFNEGRALTLEQAVAYALEAWTAED
jgi:predicted ATPase/transcriptional regulator with XRE-family HTH domain